MENDEKKQLAVPDENQKHIFLILVVSITSTHILYYCLFIIIYINVSTDRDGHAHFIKLLDILCLFFTFFFKLVYTIH